MTYTIRKPYADPEKQRMAEWVGEMMEASKATAEKVKVTPEAIVAQAALEAGWGRHAIGHNLFGIKADASWEGPVLVRRTKEHRPDGTDHFEEARFRDYPSFAESVADHFAFLDGNKRYREKGVFDGKGDEAYFTALKAAGYATDRDYVSKLMAVLASVRGFLANMTTDGSAPPAQRLLLVGTHGSDVKALQAQLKSKDFYKDEIDGDFGPNTRIAVVAFQKARRLEPDGVVGDDTWRELSKS